MFSREVYRHSRRSGEWRATKEPSMSPKGRGEEGCWRHWVSEMQGRLWKSNRKGRKEDRNKRRKDNNVGKVKKKKLPTGRALTVTNMYSHLKCAHRSVGTFATFNKTTQAQSELIKEWTGMEKTAWRKLISKTDLQAKLNHHATSGLGDQRNYGRTRKLSPGKRPWCLTSRRVLYLERHFHEI